MIQQFTMIEWPQAQVLPMALNPSPTIRYGWFVLAGLLLLLLAFVYYKITEEKDRYRLE